MSVTPEFLRAIQEHGWMIHSVEADRVIAECPWQGCALKVCLVPGDAIPSTRGAAAGFKLRLIRTDQDIRDVVREGRERFGLSMTMAGEAAGLADGHWNKFEKDNPDKMLNFNTGPVVLETVGYSLAAFQTHLLPVVTRAIAETRAGLERRRGIQQRAAIERDARRAAD